MTDRSKNLADVADAAAAGALRDDGGAFALVQLLDYMMPDAKRIDPIAEYFLKMARMTLLEAEQKRADVIGRH